MTKIFPDCPCFRFIMWDHTVTLWPVLCPDWLFVLCVRDEDAPAKIPDEDASKPEGWLDDEPEYVPDPDAEKPEDW